MATVMEYPTIAFVWRQQDITSAVIEATRNTRIRAIFDLNGSDLNSAAASIVRADAGTGSSYVKISPEQLDETSLHDFSEETSINCIWTDLVPFFLQRDPAHYLELMDELSEDFTFYPVVGDFELLDLIVRRHPKIRNVAIKGSEAGGFTGSENLLSFFAAARKLLDVADSYARIHVWGGIATPEAAAAFLATGAQGIIFESLHWLTDLVSADESARQKIAKLRPEHTELVGLNLQAPCRLYNKGNSLAVKDVREFAGSLCGAEIAEEPRRFFAGRIAGSARHPLDSSFSRDEVIPIGVEAAFAGSFASRFGESTERAIENFLGEIERQLSIVSEKERAFVGGSVADRMGTRYALVQGAMSWITDVPKFALKVAEAGALPTIALGLMPKSVMEAKLGNLKTLMGEKPFAVNVITLQENPYRDEQLAWIREQKPTFAVIAAGEPSHAAELLESGVEVIYIAPNERLLELAFGAGIRYVICEGNEAGGHVGEHSTMTLAQIILDRKASDPTLFEGRNIILAGGVCDRENAVIAALLGADAIQVGTSYLATREIVETGALTDLYQRMILDARPGGTVVTGEGTGLRVRSLRTPKIESVCSLERDFAAGSTNEADFRRQIEQVSAGSLFIAARGLDRPNGQSLDEETCIEQGQFMSGACAGVVDKVRSCAQLHADLVEKSLSNGLPFLGPIREAPVERLSIEVQEPTLAPIGVREPTSPIIYAQERIAVTGLSIVNSLGNSPEEVWEACLAMRSGIVSVPSSKWPHEMFFDPRPRVSEKTYCKFGAFQQIEVSRKELGIPPQDFRTMTASTKITMWLAKQAIEDSGILSSEIPRKRIAVLISQNSGEAAATLEDMIVRNAAKRIVDSVKSVIEMTGETSDAVEESIKAGRMAVDDTTLLGRLNCTAGGFICNTYGFMGPSFAVSAACATALVALYSAYQMIRNDIIDAAVIGGAEEPLTPMHFLEFSALGALAGLSGAERRPEEVSRPFNFDRDGMVLGEGGGMIVIERESVARERGAKVHAYITGMGASNNHLGMVESSRITQEIAIGASFDDAPYGPEAVDMIECHATSTMQGDVEEVLALKRFFNEKNPVVLTSFKSQIGHTLGASGVNSMIRGIMAMKAGIYPPTLNFQKPDEEMGLVGSGLTIMSEPVDWSRRNGSPRRFQVNAFGFGGSNYVVQLEEAKEDDEVVLVSPAKGTVRTRKRPCMLPLPSGIHFFRTEIGRKPHRLAIVADTDAEATSILQSVEPLRRGDEVSAKQLRSLSKQAIFIGSMQDGPSPLAFIFPGQGSHYAGMGHELYDTFPIIREWMDKTAKVAEFDLLQLLFYDREEDLQKTRWQQPALFTMEYAMVQYLVALGVKPTALAGHSLGELTALCLAGVYSFEDGFRIVNKRAVCMDKACGMHADPGVMMAVDAPLAYIEEILKQKEEIYITNINSPKQVVLGGNTEAVKDLGEDLKSQGYRRTLLKVSMAFHSPIMRCIHDELEEFVSGIEFHAPQIPVISNTTMKPFPEDTSEIRRILMAHLESPVHWMQNVNTLWNDYSVRQFVEIGPRDILCNLVMDILESSECIHTCLPGSESQILRNSIAQLYAKGHLPEEVDGRFVTFPGQEKTSARPVHKGATPLPRREGPMEVPDGVDPEVFSRIEAFVRESFGRFLRPGLLDALRREHDPKFSEETLDSVLFSLFPGLAGAPLPRPQLPLAPGTVVTATPVVSALPKVAPIPTSGETDEVTETVIRLIMDATGYERNEIEPSMDLREDLSIRSSRLPVIMDSMEGQFGIKIHLEDFMEVRSIADIVDKLKELIGTDDAHPRQSKDARRGETSSLSEGRDVETPDIQEPIRRLVFRETKIEATETTPVELTPEDAVIIFSPVTNSPFVVNLRKAFTDLSGGDPTDVAYLHQEQLSTCHGFDLRTTDFDSVDKGWIEKLQSAAGLVIAVDELFDKNVTNPNEISLVLKGLFSIVKTFTNSPSKKFAFLVMNSEHNPEMSLLLSEGVLGIFLSLSHEFSSVQFRVMRFEDSTDVPAALREALNRGQKVIETIYRNCLVFSRSGQPDLLRMGEKKSLGLGRDDVMVVSGGARGITYHIARNTANLGCKMVFLGTTAIDPDIDYMKLIALETCSDDDITAEIRHSKPGMSHDTINQEIIRVSKALEIIRNVEELRAMGTEASYYRCDVTDPVQVAAVMSEILQRYGRINGVIHGAGILKDSFVRQMSERDFAVVTDVKFLGAWNLYKATEKAGLKFFGCLSSAAAIQGNPGQTNYAAANRIMSGLMTQLSATNTSVVFKSCHLPPIEGVGMAEDDEIRALMKRMKASYIKVDELATLFTREFLYGNRDDTWVLFMRSLPELASSLLIAGDAQPENDDLIAGTLAFKRQNFPMVDEITSMDLHKGELQAVRVFSREKDLWIPDHKPFKFLKHPLVSAIMAIETFMESACLLYPEFNVVGVRQAEFLDILECPPEIERWSQIVCRRISQDRGGVVCEVSLAARDISPTGRMMDDLSLNYRAHVVLAIEPGIPDMEMPNFPVRQEELDSRPMPPQEVLDWYKDRSHMEGRYKLMTEMDGSGPDSVRGRFVYRQIDDFTPPLKTAYAYSPYLLEALMQASMFYVGMRNEEEKRVMIPHSIGEIVFSRRCQIGETITVEGRMREMNDQGLIWEARGLDEQGRCLMCLKRMVLKWFNG